MIKKKFYILALVNGEPQGYVKSVLLSKNKYTLTLSKAEAKSYSTPDACQNEIDRLAAIAFNTNNNVIFMYE